MDLHKRIESSYEHLHTLLSTSTVSPHQLGKLEKQYQDLFSHYNGVTTLLGSGVERTDALTRDLERKLEMSCMAFGQTVNTQLAAHARDDADKKRAIDALTREAQRQQRQLLAQRQELLDQRKRVASQQESFEEQSRRYQLLEHQLNKWAENEPARFEKTIQESRALVGLFEDLRQNNSKELKELTDAIMDEVRQHTSGIGYQAPTAEDVIDILEERSRRTGSLAPSLDIHRSIEHVLPLPSQPGTAALGKGSSVQGVKSSSSTRER